MRVFAFLVVLLMLPIATAISDLSVYSEAKYSSQNDAPLLVEWFHGEGDEDQVEDLRKMDRDGEITLLHWRTGAEEEDAVIIAASVFNLKLIFLDANFCSSSNSPCTALFCSAICSLLYSAPPPAASDLVAVAIDCSLDISPKIPDVLTAFAWNSAAFIAESSLPSFSLFVCSWISLLIPSIFSFVKSKD